MAQPHIPVQAASGPREPAAAASSTRLRGIVLLAGAVRANRLRRSLRRFVLELPVDEQRCVMDLWQEQLSPTAASFGRPALDARVLVDRTSPMPADNRWKGGEDGCGVRFEQDPLDFRGTGGLLRDLAQPHGPQDYLLIVNAAQLLFPPLAEVAADLARLNADIALACDARGGPIGVMLVRCGCLESIPRVGYIDFNEQGLPLIARHHDVRVWRVASRPNAPIRTLEDYLEALRRRHRREAGQSDDNDPFRETWHTNFGVVEAGAQVDAHAVVHDSVVLSGGRVASGAVVVRSLVCPGAVVGEGATVIDRIVSDHGASMWRSRR